MTKDFKQSYNSDTKEAISGLGWMVSGIAIGLLAGVGMYFYNSYQTVPIDNPDNEQIQAQTASQVQGTEVDYEKSNVNGLGLEEPDPISVVIDNSRKEQTEKKRATFSYYAVLPDLELDVTVQPSKYDFQQQAVVQDNQNGNTTEQATAQAKKPTTEKLVLKSGSYILQLASFRTMNKANKAQKNLANRGMETHIEKKIIRGNTWYRLFMGPTADENMISSWKATVEKIGYQPLAVKIK